MEWVLPIQKLEVGNITLASPWVKDAARQKPLATLSYKEDNAYSLPTLSILLPPLPIVSYDQQSGKLELDCSAEHLVSLKLQTLQDTLLSAIQYNQYSWYQTSYKAEEIRVGFQPLFEGNRCIIYCPIQQDQREGYYSNGIPLFKGGKWNQAKAQDFQAGRKIRIAMKIHGISFLMRGEQPKWSSRSRIQHRILGIVTSNHS